MLTNMTRARVIQLWFVGVGLAVVTPVAFGVQMSLATAGLMLVLSLVPPLVVFLLWPGPQSLTAGEVLRGTDRRS
jgi:hypothetical protein